VKRLLKKAVRPFWRLTGPLRRPIARRLDARIQVMISLALRQEVLPAIQVSLDASTHAMARLEASIGAANHSAQTLATDMDLMLSSVIREIARLQVQVDAIEDMLAHNLAPGRSSLSLVERDEDTGPVERSRVG
jgi:hypothetical protein